MFHKSRKFSNSWSCHRIATVLSCHSETSAHTGRGNPFPKAPSDEGAPPEGRWGREKTISLPPSPAVTPPSSEGGIGSADCHGLRTVQRPVPTAPRNDSGGTRKAPLPKGGSARRAVGDSLCRSCIPRRERIYPFHPRNCHPEQAAQRRADLAPLAGELSPKVTEGLPQTLPALRATFPAGKADSATLCGHSE